MGIGVASPRPNAHQRNWSRGWPSSRRRQEGRLTGTVAVYPELRRAYGRQCRPPGARRSLLEGMTSAVKALLRRPPISTRARRRRLSRDLKLRLPAPSSKPGLPWHGMVPSLPARRPKLRLGDPPSPTARRHRRPSDRHRGRRAADATLGSSSAPRWEKLRGYVWATELGRPKASRVLRTAHRSARASAAGPRAGCDNPDGCRRPGAVCSAEAGGGFGRRGREAPERTRGHASCAGCTRRCC